MTREEKIRLLNELLEIEEKNDIGNLTRAERAEFKEWVDMAISALKSGWIPITEGMELPEHDVICCDNEGNIALGYLYFDEEENQIACDRDPYVMFGVVAYMELPEPYKAESEDKE